MKRRRNTKLADAFGDTRAAAGKSRKSKRSKRARKPAKTPVNVGKRWL